MGDAVPSEVEGYLDLFEQPGRGDSMWVGMRIAGAGRNVGSPVFFVHGALDFPVISVAG